MMEDMVTVELLRSILDRESQGGAALFAPVGGGADFVCLHADPAIACLAPGTRLLGRTHAQVWPRGGPIPLHAMREVLETGETWEDLEVPVEVGRADGSEVVYHSVKLARLETDGERYVVAVVPAPTEADAEPKAGRTKDPTFNGVGELGYRELLGVLDTGFAVCELLRDEGLPVGYRTVEANPAFLRHSEGATVADGDRILEACAGVVETGEATRLRRRHPGRDHWFDLQLLPFGGDRFVQVSEDITERIRAGRNEERLLALMRHNPSLVFLKDEEGRYVYLNEAYERTFVGTGDWYGKTDFDFWPAESAELFRENDSRVLRSDRTTQFLEESTDLAGVHHCWLCYKFPFTDSDGARYVGGIGIDATDRRLVERTLQESNRRDEYLLRLSDGLRPLEDVSELGRTAARLVMEELDAACACYSETGTDRGGAVIHHECVRREGRGKLSSEATPCPCSSSTLHDPLVIGDVRTAAGLAEGERREWESAGVQAFVAVPLPGGDGELARLTVGHSKPRGWTPSEVRLVRETADRTSASIERARAEEALRESRARYQALVETTSDFIWETDASGRYTYCSPQMERLWGMAPEDMLGKTPFDVMPDEERRRLLPWFAEMSRAPAPFTIESVAFDGQGGLIHVETSGVPYLSAGGTWLGFRGVTRDVTGRTRDKAALRESEARANDLIRFAPTGIYEIDFRTQRFTSVNEAMSVLSGYSREELLAMNATEILEPESRARFAERVRLSLSGEAPPEEVEYRVRRKDGHVIYVTLNVRFIRDHDGTVSGAFVIGHDVTERVRAAEERALLLEAEQAAREQAGRELETTMRLLDAAVALASHPTLAEVLDALTEAVLHSVGHSRVTVSLVGQSGTSVTVAASRGAEPIPPGRFIAVASMSEGARLAFESREPQFIDYDALEPGERGAADEIESHLALDVPLVYRDRVLGLLAIDDPRSRRPFTPRDVDIAVGIAAQAAVAIENARLFEAQQAELQRTTVLKELAYAVATSLDPVELSQRTLGIAEDLLGADAGAVHLLDDGIPAVAASFGEYTHDPGAEGASPQGAALAGQAISTGRVVTRAAGQGHPARSGAAGEVGEYRHAAIPLRSRGDVTGVIVLRFPSARPFSAGETYLYEAVGDQLSAGLENARLYQAQRGIAETLQETLVVLPSHIPGIAYSRAYESATLELGRVGGDFVDVFPIREGLVGVALGDVSGKGIDAAVTTSLVRTTLRVHALDGLSPAEAAGKANTVMQGFTDPDAFVTLWFGLLDTFTLTLRYISAGHPPALVVRAGGATRELETADPILGAYGEATFREREMLLIPGDRLILYSDGVTEARSPEGFFLDAEGFRELVEGNHGTDTCAFADVLMREVVAFSGGILRDDAAILTVEPIRRCDLGPEGPAR